MTPYRVLRVPASGRGSPSLRAPWPAMRRAVARRRRLVAALLAGLAVLCGLSAVRPAPPPTVLVLAAARDLSSGAALALADLRPVALPPSAVPDGALRPGAEVLGRLLAGPVRRGEPLTDVRLVGPGLFAALAPGSVAVPVRFADAGVAALLRPGDRLDVLAAPTGSPALAAGPGDPSGPAASGADPAPDGAAPDEARVVASDVVVLAVPGAPDPAAPPDAYSPAGFGDGTLVVVGCSPAVARALAAAGGGRLSPALRPTGRSP